MRRKRKNQFDTDESMMGLFADDSTKLKKRKQQTSIFTQQVATFITAANQHRFRRFRPGADLSISIPVNIHTQTASSDITHKLGKLSATLSTPTLQHLARANFYYN
eukprot:UN03848